MFELEGCILTRGEKQSLLCIVFVAKVRVEFRQFPYDVLADFIPRLPLFAYGQVLSPTVYSSGATVCSLTIILSA